MNIKSWVSFYTDHEKEKKYLHVHIFCFSTSREDRIFRISQFVFHEIDNERWM